MDRENDTETFIVVRNPYSTSQNSFLGIWIKLSSILSQIRANFYTVLFSSSRANSIVSTDNDQTITTGIFRDQEQPLTIGLKMLKNTLVTLLIE